MYIKGAVTQKVKLQYVESIDLIIMKHIVIDYLNMTALYMIKF
ncbi:hypothetical protein CNEO4_1040012 [Clostridium neonatale]|nr:hypothetical protein CNEO4_1120027 [Clostridium neonatale]CAI3552152.1 hypothetical protein CNEO4_1040012 [Clostridium neonatale]CAI3569244.1 hypothetical protein CNEO4_1110027 [Clostridium neonatale]CAI3572707.1 hypothetical protein CNEO4_440027 [Clostridium neonatale]CAI3670639.1 hypothetical protein CNEO3_490028 [Clostridium neonatale]